MAQGPVVRVMKRVATAVPAHLAGQPTTFSEQVGVDLCSRTHSADAWHEHSGGKQLREGRKGVHRKLHISMLPAGLIILSSVLCRCLPAA